ncbi:Multifunctional CCA protein [Slackia heliotrinireducens]|uniref:tRNA nucleotidyltransferase/poly(A) polymerase n=1 Tax=Slackia heliotrinireducens (strain ATCC 29202 / DSM 20476 / NCTC 11029 / RHS 1) TaxID=471855 RepID=C7N377_SLAHD|nr:HD domain-containing protein [Slackia heliotrinireducens]ACV21598.1 tRNA nucleotidyltransferase/poly(A) polymerase [Slackia heliotrinireducens DSM 20476]VEG99136.1 Multifunctional CCA protein [Slackia heliotrinireducens]
MQYDNAEMARKIAEQVDRHGGRTFYVGGMVRDRLLGRENKDIDIEVHGIPADELGRILSELGEVTAMGASFGIFGLKHYDVDIAMPRKENATGRGHKDFEVFTDPFLGPEKAAMRRDFTMNALMEDVLTGEVLDFFGGQEDMRRGVIRHVNDRTFAEDPLRVLRAAQFAARFGFRVADETVALSSRMDLSALSSERIVGEMDKAMLKAAKPSIFFNEMRAMDQLDVWFPELKALIGVEQEPAFHPEGDVWNHTMRVVDLAAGLRGQASNPRYFMYASLVHDLGKIVTTQVIDGRIRAFGHEYEGVPIAKTFLGRLTNESGLIRYATNMMTLHMRPNMLAAQHAGRKPYMKLFDESVSPEDLLLLSEADFCGRDVDSSTYTYGAILQENLAFYRDAMAKPFVQGRDLIDAGFEPGPDFGEALELGHKLRISLVSKEHALPQVLAFLRRSRGIRND